MRMLHRLRGLSRRSSPLRVRDEKGQAMVEFVVAAPVLAIFLFAIWFISDMYEVKFQTLVAARYGAWRLAREDGMPGVNYQALKTGVMGKIKEYYFDDDNLLTMAEVNAPEGTGYIARLLDEIIDFVNDVMSKSNHSTTYGMKVEYRVPLMTELNVFDTENILPDEFTISSTHYVCGNSWNGCKTEVHEMFGLIYETIGTVFERLFDLEDLDVPGEAP